MSLSKNSTGRKKESAVWEWFEYDIPSDTCKCIVMDKATGKMCNRKIAGRNTTNKKSRKTSISQNE